MAEIDRGYGRVMRSVMRNPSVSSGGKALYAYLCSFAGASGVCYPTQRLMCHELAVCENTLLRYLRELKEAGIVSVEREKHGKYSNNVYRLNDEFNALASHIPQNLMPDFLSSENLIPQCFTDEEVRTINNNTNSNNKINKNNITNNSNKAIKNIFLDMIDKENSDD